MWVYWRKKGGEGLGSKLLHISPAQPRNGQFTIVTLSILPGAESTPAGAHQMEPPSPIQALAVNPFQSRFIIRTVPRGDNAPKWKSQAQRRNDSAIVLHQTVKTTVLTGQIKS